MTVPAIEPVKNHYGNGSNTTFDFNFYIENESQLCVYKTVDNKDIKLICGVDYSINETGNKNGSYITFPLSTSIYPVLQSNEVLSIQLDLPISQESEYGTSDKLNLDAIEYSLDVIVRIIQILARKIARAVKISEGSNLTAEQLLQSIYETSEKTKINADSAINAAQSVYNTSLLLQEMIEQVQTIIDENFITNPVFTSTHTLFEILDLDKTLSGKELIGLGLQNTSQSYENYPTAYLELANEFENSEKKVYSSATGQTVCKKFTGDVTGVFYIPYADSIEDGTEIFSNVSLTTSLGTIADVISSLANSFVGSNYNFYIPFENDLENGITAYSDSTLNTSIGTVQDIKNVVGKKYTADETGVFYTENKAITAGLKIYSDPALTDEKGSITSVSTQKSDKYSIINYGNVYVNEGSDLSVGTNLYSDIALTNKVATVTSKGSASSSGNVYTYKASGNGLAVNPKLNGLSSFVATLNDWTFYTKTPIAVGVDVFEDSACTNKNGSVKTITTNGGITIQNVHVKNYNKGLCNCTYSSYSLVSQNQVGTAKYIILDSDSTQYIYSKICTDSIDVVSINTEANETFSLDEVYEKSFVKIGSLDYQEYKSDGTTINNKISLNGTTYENITDNGITAQTGLNFEYAQAADGHKIVDIKYKNLIDSYIQTNGKSPFYLIDIKNKTFVLPLKDSAKNIYFALGNRFIKSASIDVLNMIYDKLDSVNSTVSDILGV